MNRIRTRCVALLVIALAVTSLSQTEKEPLAAVPKDQRLALTKRLDAYTTAYRKKDWYSLYDLVSDVNKMQFDKLKVDRQVFMLDMHGTYDLARLINFIPVRTDTVSPGVLNIYGCGHLPYGKEETERIAAVRAVREHDNWYFTNWDYPDPPEPCSHLSDPAWKPSRYMEKLNGPMYQLTCEFNICTL